MKQVVPVTSKRQLKQFIDFPHDLYRDDVNYVPELFIAQKDLLTTHPFHKHSSLQCFLAMEGDKVTGRIAAILNNNHNTFNKSNDGFFGFFDCIDDVETAALLFAEATAWLKAKGVATVIGPVNFSTNETCGMLLEGFDRPPVAMMTYNKPYYLRLVEQNGFGKKTDLLAYEITDSDYSDRSAKMVELLEERLKQRHITIRKANMKDFANEVAAIHSVYNAAWDKNLGFVPMTEAEFKYMAKDLKLVIDPDFVLVAEHEGKMIGFALCIPDINQVLIKVKRGRLFPTGIFKLLTQRKKIKGVRVIALGVLEGYRKMGIEGCFYGRIIRTCLEKGIRNAEASWILEDNDMMNRAIEHIKGRVYKKYRIYEKTI